MTAPVTVSSGDRSYYEQDEFWTDEQVSDREARRLSETVTALPMTNSHADIGAGDGRFLNALVATRGTATLAVAVERSWAALSLARGHRIVGDVTRLPLRDEAIDSASVCEVIEHLPVDVYTQALQEIERVARDYILVTVPNREDLARGMVRCPSCTCVFHRHRHLRSFDEAVLRGLFTRFDLLYLNEIGPLELVIPGSLVRLARRLGAAPGAGGSPLCPQCGFYNIEPEKVSRSPAPAHRSSAASRVRRMAIRAAIDDRVPMPRKAPWLLALYGRRK